MDTATISLRAMVALPRTVRGREFSAARLMAPLNKLLGVMTGHAA